MNFQWPINDSERIGTLQELRSSRMVKALPKEEIDDWLKQSVALVAGCVRGLGTNQRKVRYFGFERPHEQIKE
jgi:hypothetical protein